MTDSATFIDLPVPGVPGAEPRHRVHYRRIDADSPDAPLLIFLHEGLGSVEMWRDFPDRVCAQLNCRGLLYSRYGYGRSTPRPASQRWPVDYMHHHAQHVLPALYRALGIDAELRPPVLYGHSDGGTIALLHAVYHPEHVAGMVVAAPHVMVEDVTIRGIEHARRAYLHTDLRSRLSRYHSDVDSAFWAWNDIWLSPGFRPFDIRSSLSAIDCPLIALQGVDDEYGTLDQIDDIGARVPHALVRPLTACGHTPHKDQPIAVIDALAQVLAHSPTPSDPSL